MENKNYQKFVQEEEIAVGIPISMPDPQNGYPGFPSQPQVHSHNGQHYPMVIQTTTQHVTGHLPQFHVQQAPAPIFAQGNLNDYTKQVNTKCPCCHSQVTTVINYEAGNAAYLWAGLIFCCISPFCACLPFLTDKCMDRNHYCPNCGFNIVRKHRGFFDCS